MAVRRQPVSQIRCNGDHNHHPIFKSHVKGVTRVKDRPASVCVATSRLSEAYMQELHAADWLTHSPKLGVSASPAQMASMELLSETDRIANQTMHEACD